MSPAPDDEEASIGSVSGQFARAISPDDLINAADSVSGDSLEMAVAAAQVMRNSTHYYGAILIEDVTITPQYRGHRLLSKIVDEICDQLDLDEDASIIVALPEPTNPEGSGPYTDEDQRYEAQCKILPTFTQAGFAPVRGSSA